METKKISLERKNKQLRSELRDLQEIIDSRRVRPLSTCDADSRQLQQELLERNQEMAELKHCYTKLKKRLAKKTTEFLNALRRSDKYEAEVKRVRAKLEELKKELSTAQEEVYASTNTVRRLQRVKKDLVEQLESANVQLNHFMDR